MINIHKLAIESGLAAIGIAPAIDEVRSRFPWAESVVAAAISYLPPDCQVADNQPRGLVARVARSADYHTVLRNKLEQISAYLKSEHPQAQLEICVDTTPIPERKLAVLAGIAWQGKNGNVFVQGCGSYAVLGEIITSIKLPISEPLSVDNCVNCNKCMRACPTGAITAPGVLDPNKCLSQLTQTSGIIPHELRLHMQNRIYGCDICQEACPQNANIKLISPEFAQPIYPGAYPELIPLINLSSHDFKTNVKNSSIGWIRRTRIRRNAAIAAGNLKCNGAIPALTIMLRDENPVLRAHAAWALGEIASEDALNALNQALACEQDADIIKEIRLALSKGNMT